MLINNEGMKGSSVYLLITTCSCTYRCDRILFHGKGLRQLSYVMVEAKLSDHRPVSTRFIADVESVSGRKLRKACRLSSDAKVNVEELLLRTIPVGKIHGLHNSEVFDRKLFPFC